MSQEPRAHFASRIGLILSVLGIAVGTGNIWRFPRIAAQQGGDDGAGAFLIAWLIFLLLWSIPLIIAEYALGRYSRMSVVGTFAKVAGRKFSWMGGFVGFVSAGIMFFYSVVAGWCIFYFFEMFLNPLPLTTEAAEGVWDKLQTGIRPLLFHAMAIVLAATVIWKGVRSIERANKVLIPTLLAIVIASVIRALTLEGSAEGLRFLFTPQWDLLANPRLWLEALTQNAWDTGAGWGLILTYGVYMQHRHGVVQNAVITGVGNNLVSLLAATMIFGTVFAVLGAEMSQSEILEIMQTSGPASTGLTFIWMPQLFAQMPLGGVLAVLFFLALSFAAFSSLISMMELCTRTIVDLGFRRKKAILFVAVVGFSLGIPSALYLNFLSNQDFVWGIGLMISGAFIAFAVLRFGAKKFREEAVTTTPDDWKPGVSWDVAMRFIIPIEAVILLVWWLFLSVTQFAPDTWFNPFEPYSIMTCLVQWGIIMAIMISSNKWLTQNTLRSDPRY